MKEPIEPSKEDCCNSGCNPCIFDVYEKQLAKYKKYLECGEHTSNVIEENAISQLHYTCFIVVDNLSLCDSHVLLTLRRQKSDDVKVRWKPGQHFLYKFHCKGNVCTRAYTPVNIKIKSNNTFDFAIIVKKYKNGLVSNYLYNICKGVETLWRGPYGDYNITQNKFSRIIMIAQGTGIAPFISIIENILNDEDNITKIILLYCCQSVNTILFRDELYNFKLYWNFSYQLYIHNVNEESKIKYLEPIVKCKLNYTALEQFLPLTKNEQFLLCGSRQFMEHYKLYLLNKQVKSENIILF